MLSHVSRASRLPPLELWRSEARRRHRRLRARVGVHTAMPFGKPRLQLLTPAGFIGDAISDSRGRHHPPCPWIEMVKGPDDKGLSRPGTYAALARGSPRQRKRRQTPGLLSERDGFCCTASPTRGTRAANRRHLSGRSIAGGRFHLRVDLLQSNWQSDCELSRLRLCFPAPTAAPWRPSNRSLPLTRCPS